jgi:multidrug efflux pump subunit AcrB
VTAAGFLPVGFANSAVGEYTGSIFSGIARRADRLMVCRGDVPPYLGVKLLPDFTKPSASRSDEIYRTFIAGSRRRHWAVDYRGVVIAGVIGVFALAVFGFFVVPKQFFPCRRLELFLQLRLPEGTSIGASLEAAKQAEMLLRTIGRRPLRLCRTGPPRLARPQSAAPEQAYSEIVIVAKGHRGAQR